ESEGTDVERLFDETRDDFVTASHGPEQTRQRDIDHHQHGSQKRDLATEKAEARVDVGREDAEEMVDDAEIVHRTTFAGAGVESAEGSSPDVEGSDGDVLRSPKKCRRHASRATRQRGSSAAS